MVRLITQETYDEVVKENMEEFDMDPEAAIKEAIEQFEAQGVDLSNIIKDLILSAGDSNPISSPIFRIKELSTSNIIDEEQITKDLEALKIECSKDIARKMKAGKDDAYPILIDLLEKRTKDFTSQAKEKDGLIVNILNTLTSFMDGQPDYLNEKGLELIKILLKAKNEPIQLATLKWITVCCIKHETNRQKLFAGNISDELLVFLTQSKNNKILSEAMNVTRKLTLDDDIRVEFGKAHEHARELGLKLLEPLTALLQANSKSPLTSELLLTIACLLVRHELCKMAAGCVPALLEAMTDNCGDIVQVQQGNKLITALAGNDEVKRDLMKSGVAPLLVLLLSKHASNAPTSSITLKAIAALALREPEHSTQFIDCDVQDAIIQCMKIHPDNASVQKNACWAIRNLVARGKEHNPKFKELGVETLLNSAYEKFSKEFGYDIKSALRDLDCDVKFEEQWTGKGVQMQQ